MKTIWILEESADVVTGKGPLVTLAAFWGEGNADEARREDPMVRKIRLVPLYATYEEYKHRHDERLRQQALAKLTDEEKKALGIKL